MSALFFKIFIIIIAAFFIIAILIVKKENIVKETPTFHKNNIRFTTIGDNSLLPEKALRKLEECIAETALNTGFGENHPF